jgi:DeoR/GlpR family transcriptional regulator of sugar metabolism
MQIWRFALMTPFERQQQILSLLKEKAGIKIPEIAGYLGVSQGTIRNDLDVLEKSGQISRVRGGAVVHDERQFLPSSFAARSLINGVQKQNIARLASTLVEDGDSILLDASTTVFAMVPYLKNYQNLTIVTNGISIGYTLAQNPSHTVILLGGVIRPVSSSVAGHLSGQMLDILHVKTAFVSCSGISVDAGLTEVDIHEVDIKRKMVRCAERVIALIDSSKFGKLDLSSFASLDQISHLFTDREVPAEFDARFKQNCTLVTICSSDSAISSSPCDQEPGNKINHSLFEVSRPN